MSLLENILNLGPATAKQHHHVELVLRHFRLQLLLTKPFANWQRLMMDPVYMQLAFANEVLMHNWEIIHIITKLSTSVKGKKISGGLPYPFAKISESAFTYVLVHIDIKQAAYASVYVYTFHMSLLSRLICNFLSRPQTYYIAYDCFEMSLFAPEHRQIFSNQISIA